jgi:hypothetical protein
MTLVFLTLIGVVLLVGATLAYRLWNGDWGG